MSLIRQNRRYFPKNHIHIFFKSNLLRVSTILSIYYDSLAVISFVRKYLNDRNIYSLCHSLSVRQQLCITKRIPYKQEQKNNAYGPG
ncbi:hypothetical protein GWI33_006786 [Rhynchophorus ferrugineus]|uniref:Uncharacterized protein n=1 Tax=Rhynchophorus ferrugineus TaxID=354439 RepID=A0A834IIA9_RHYFE|nr:hypothetical protein GWI33_006786 [Rhynchophorus ferrugineus]